MILKNTESRLDQILKASGWLFSVGTIVVFFASTAVTYFSSDTLDIFTMFFTADMFAFVTLSVNVALSLWLGKTDLLFPQRGAYTLHPPYDFIVRGASNANVSFGFFMTLKIVFALVFGGIACATVQFL